MDHQNDRQTRVLKLVELFDDLVGDQNSPDDVAHQLKGAIGEPDLVDEAREKYEDRIRRIHSLKYSTTLTEEDGEQWYPGPQSGDVFWPSLRDYLLDEKFEERVVDSIDEESTKVVSCLDAPWAPDIDTRGLVVGHVQSGKTANFTAVTSKAADVGYRIFIVLSGMTNSLRQQTQRRMERELVDLNPNRWHRLTREDSDFVRPATRAASLLASEDQKLIAITKKNSARLRKLVDWLKGAGESVLSNAPALVIDDEADYASVNTRDDMGERSTINSLIIELLDTLPRSAYVGYTATPFANVFINPQAPEDLYPRSFIHALPTPEEYFGPETIFGRDRLEFDDSEPIDDGYQMVRRDVSTEELSSLNASESDRDREEFQPEVTPSLRTALRYFVMATAARRVREQEGFFSTMLVHTDLHIAVQNQLGDRLREEVTALRSRIAREPEQLYEELRREWENESARVDSRSFELEPISFDDLVRHLPDVAEDLKVVVANSQSEDSLDYESDRGTYVVVGGNVLSRGLTLEGLMVSFFVRRAGNYDTLLQMGRWFGYWEDYADLPRLWMTEQLYDFFYDLATVEREIRHDIQRYTETGVTPTEFAVRVRTHPTLNITSRSKMTSVVEVPSSYSGHEIQTTWFHHRDREWLRDNLEASRRLVSSVREDGRSFRLHEDRYRWVARGVDVEHVLNFLKTFEFHEHDEKFNANSLLKYINRQLDRGHLERWNVAVIGQERKDLGTVNLSLPKPARLLTRSRLEGAGSRGRDAYIKALMSKQDVVADFETLPDNVSNLDWEGLSSRRETQSPYDERGLLLLYPIAKDSEPSTGSSQRAPLEAEEHMIGVALVFPDTDDFAADTYVHARLGHEPEDVA